MSFDAILVSVSAPEYAALKAGRVAPNAVLQAQAPRSLSLLDHWSALTLLLTGHLLSPTDEADEVLVGSEVLGPAVRAVPPAHVKLIHRALSGLKPEALSARLSDIVDSIEDELERSFGFESAADGVTLLTLAQQVKDLYADAARRGHAVLVHSALFQNVPSLRIAATKRPARHAASHGGARPPKPRKSGRGHPAAASASRRARQ